MYSLLLLSLGKSELGTAISFFEQEGFSVIGADITKAAEADLVALYEAAKEYPNCLEIEPLLNGLTAIIFFNRLQSVEVELAVQVKAKFKTSKFIRNCPKEAISFWFGKTHLEMIQPPRYTLPSILW